MHLQELTQSNRCSERMHSPATWKGDGQDTGGGGLVCCVAVHLQQKDAVRHLGTQRNHTYQGQRQGRVTSRDHTCGCISSSQGARFLDDGNADQRQRRIIGSPFLVEGCLLR